MKNNSKVWPVIVVVIAVVIVGVAAFLGGMKVQKSKDKTVAPISTFTRGNFANMSTGQGGQTVTGGGRIAGYGGLSGQIASVGANSITITTSSGSTETINFDSSTTIASEIAATASNLVVGKTITITPNFGNAGNTGNNTNTITARRITITD